MLQSVLWGNLRYAEHYKDGMTLENEPCINAQKTHDLDFILDPNPDVVHIIQYREFKSSVKSWHKLEIEYSNNALNLEQFELEKEKLYHDWVQKWIIKPVPNRTLVNYCDLCDQTSVTVARVLKSMTDMGDAECLAMAELAIDNIPLSSTQGAQALLGLIQKSGHTTP